ncbi:tail fiber domain-containing protein [Chryseobacterium sp. ERMR1:04]|uniref:tail fiber domain-containing protein n=1 Tax=Chryseobacterium sp. ERMR1:04 TaxID=1705393 RepID=UPI0006C89CE5|nr:tail fiber domain-containing protein [Chryseobacterium sp. ERMR1:04]
MKKVLLTSLFVLGTYSYAQVGVNTTTPASTLDVTAKNATGTTTNVDGLLAPRVDRLRAQSMTAVPNSTLIYINSIANGTQTGTAINVNAVGYYYFDGTVWAKVYSSSAPNNSINIYTNDGSLGGNRIVTQAANTLTFTGTAVNAFSVDGTSFSVDATNHRVGLGTAAPQHMLHVVAPTANTGRYNLFDAPVSTVQNPIIALRNTSALATGNLSLLGFTNSGTTSGGANWGIGSIRSGATATNGTEEDFFFGNSNGGTYLERMRVKGNNGNVGIGTSNPAVKLDILTASQQYGFRHGDGTVILNSYVGTGSTNGATVAGWFGTTSSHPLDFMTNDTFKMRITASGNVGIGTISPANLLSVAGNADKPGGGTWAASSDRRVKKDIADFKDGLNVIKQLRPVTYRYNEKSGFKDLNKQYVGFIAQEVEKSAPYMVNIKDDTAVSGLSDRRELDDSALTKILVNAIQEQQKEIEDLKSQVKEMQKLLNK